MKSLTWIIKSGKPFPSWSVGDVTTEEWSERCHSADFEEGGTEP